MRPLSVLVPLLVPLVAPRLSRLAAAPRVALKLGAPAVLTLLCACGDSSDLPSGHWQPDPGSGAASSSGVSSSSGATGDDSGAGGSGSGGGSGGVASGSSSGASSGGGSGGAGSSSSGSGSSSSSSGGQAPPNLAVSVDQGALQMQLMATTVVHVTVAPNGYSGPVALAVAGLPTGVQAAFDHPTLTLDGKSSGTASLTLTTAPSTTPTTVSLDVTGSADGTTAHAKVSVAVESVITIHIPAGVNSMGGSVSNPVKTAFGPYPMQITAPTTLSGSSPVTVYVMNDDSVSHEIHADNPQQGFGHDPGSIPPHTMDSYVRKVTVRGSYGFYLHDQPAPDVVGLVEIQ